MANTVTISGMFGNNKTYFADSPVVIDISGLMWPPASPFNVVRVEVIYNDTVVGDFRADTGRQSEISFDISSALRAIWADYDFASELLGAAGHHGVSRGYRSYSLKVSTEYLNSVDGEYTVTSAGTFAGGRCTIGGLTEWERSLITNKADADASHWEGTNLRNGDASTKPTDTPERVGKSSITSWVDVRNSGTQCTYYAATATPAPDAAADHAPIVLRDSIDYTDFLFVNRRGAVETCSGRTLESMGISVKTQQYSRVERPSFSPTRSLTARASGGRRSWQMSSGFQTRKWAEWWTLEFLMARQWWMWYEGKFVPVTVEPSKGDIAIYDRTKQQIPHVDFTVTLALEG